MSDQRGPGELQVLRNTIEQNTKSLDRALARADYQLDIRIRRLREYGMAPEHLILARRILLKLEGLEAHIQKAILTQILEEQDGPEDSELDQ